MDKKKKKPKKGNERKMSFVEHLEELRWVIVKSIASVIVFSIAGFILSEQILNIIVAPYPEGKLIMLSPMEPFTIRLNLSVIIGIVISLPVIIYQFWSFAAPGLLEKEKKFVPWVILLTIICFLTGAVFCYYVIIPNALRFFAKYQTSTLVMMTSYDKYISFVVKLMVVFGLAFELPIVSALLSKIGILTPGLMKSVRPYAVVVIFALAAIMTPPDVISQVALGIPIIILYEISIWVTSIFEKRRERELDEALKDEDEYEYKVIEEKKGHKKIVYGLLTIVGIIILIPASNILFKIQLPFIETQLGDILPTSSKTAYFIIGLIVIVYFFAVYKVVKLQRKKTVIRIKKPIKKIRKTVPEKVKKKEKKDKKVEKKKKSEEAVKASKVEEGEEYEYDEYGYDEYGYDREEHTEPPPRKISKPRKILRWTGVIYRRPQKIWWKKRIILWNGKMIRRS